MKILAIISGEYGERHVSNIQKHKPPNWDVQKWQAPSTFPLVIDYPEDFIPEKLPKSDLLLSFGEHRGVAELVQEIAVQTGAKSVIAPIDNESWLPRGLARQLRKWMNDIDVACVTPKPLCSLTEDDYLTSRFNKISYSDPLISEFAGLFGQPDIKLIIDENSRKIKSATVIRDAVCGCARFAAEGLINVSVDDAEEKAGLLHHHFPCLASMGKDSDFGDTLMHISGNLLKENINKQVKTFKNTQYFTPGKRSE
jgi:hypothetical protein